MTQRERLMVIVLGSLLLGGVGFGAYTLVAKPVLEKQKQVKGLEDEVADLEGTRADVELRNSRRLAELHQRSLPGGGVDFARQEYDAVLYRLLQEANVPAGFTLDHDDAKSKNTTGIPALNPTDPKDKTLTYQRLVFKIGMKRASLQVVTEFLKRFYRLNLLHQITLLELKRDGTVNLDKDDRWYTQRNDLTVNIHIEAIILNGAPARKTLLSIPTENVAVLGGAGLFALQQTPSAGRAVIPPKFEEILATSPPRDYLLIAAKDPFHGSLPVPDPPKPIEKKADPITPPKPDYSGYIWYTTKFGTVEGGEETVQLLVRDKINNEDYEISLAQKGERVAAVVKKFEFNAHKIDPTKRKALLDRWDDKLEISKYTMSTRHNFRIYGLDGDALIVGEKPSGLAELTKAAAAADDGRTGRGGGGPSAARRTTLGPPDPQAVLLGGLAVTAPRAEKIYRWDFGEPLSKIVELKGKEAEKAVQRAQTGLLDRAAATPVSTTVEK